MKKLRHTTMHIFYWGLSAYFKIPALLKFCNVGQETASKSPTKHMLYVVRHAKNTPMRHLFLFFLIVFLIDHNVRGQSLNSGDFYRIDTLEIVKKLPFDSIRYNLEYVELGNDSLWFAIFPMYSIRPDQFRFLSINDMFSYTMIIKQGSGFSSDLIFSDNFSGQITKESKILDKKHIQIYSPNDSIIIIDDKVFKRDKGLKIFKLFTGY